MESKTWAFQLTFCLFFALILAFASDAEAAPHYFSRNLQVGSSGEDVRQLQIYLNSDPVTQIYSSGTGSKGLESTYFGFLTKDAVVRFQDKYKTMILTPNGLTKGTGYVGLATRNEINRQIASKNTIANPISIATTTTVPKKVELTATGPTKVPPSQANNPNFQNYDLFLAALDKRAAQLGMSATDLQNFKAAATEILATTTNLRQKFYNEMQKQAVLEIENGSMFGQIAFKVLQKLEKTLAPKTANAYSYRDFGGKLIFPFPCTCSYNWAVIMTPMDPDNVFMLTYWPYTQSYSAFNMPYASQFLGKYDPSQGSCSIYYGYGCASFYTEGTITSTVGSSGN